MYVVMYVSHVYMHVVDEVHIQGPMCTWSHCHFRWQIEIAVVLLSLTRKGSLFTQLLWRIPQALPLHDSRGYLLAVSFEKKCVYYF